MKNFIEIGSNNFQTLLPFSDHGWNGVVVEPLAEYIDDLPEAENVTFVKAAITDHDGTAIINVYNQELCESDSDYRGMSTLEKEGLTEENADVMHEEEVDCLTYQTLIDTHCSGWSQLDVLRICTEGHDLKILQSIDLEGPLRPKVIKIQHFHCNDVEMRDLLHASGYFIFVEQYDMYAVSYE